MPTPPRRLVTALSLALGLAQPARAELSCPARSTVRTLRTPQGSVEACLDAELVRRGPAVERDASGRVRLQANFEAGAMVGPFTRWYAGGARCIQGQYGAAPVRRDGAALPTGAWTEWHENGARRAEGSFQEGKKHGIFRAWDPSGTLRREVGWAMNEPDGIWRAFGPDGKPEWLVTWSRGALAGPVVRWGANGRKVEECVWRGQTRDGPCRTWNEAGVLVTEREYREDQLEGVATEWFDGGRLRKRAHYRDGALEGQYEEFHPDGQRKVAATYVGGRKEGAYRSWHENGQLELERTYRADVAQPSYTRYFPSGRVAERGTAGRLQRWHENGSLQLDGPLAGGLEQGTWRWFDEGGRIVRSIPYRRGVIDGVVVRYEAGKPVARERFHAGVGELRCPPGARRRVERQPDLAHAWCENAAGQQHGPSRYWNAAAGSAEENYRNGKLHGFVQNGPFRWTYVDGVAEGPAAVFFHSGQKLAEGAFARDEREGAWTFWYEDGRVAARGAYRDGKRQGPWTFDVEAGAAARVEVVYEAGEVRTTQAFGPDGKALPGPFDLTAALKKLPQEPSLSPFPESRIALIEEKPAEEGDEDEPAPDEPAPACASQLSGGYDPTDPAWHPSRLRWR